MTQDKCVNHPTRSAATRCKRCHSPVCLDCRIRSSDGVFCSGECVEQFREFQTRVHVPGARRGCGFSLFSWVKHLLLVAALVAIIWLVLTTWLGTTDIPEMGRQLGGMFRLLF